MPIRPNSAGKPFPTDPLTQGEPPPARPASPDMKDRSRRAMRLIGVRHPHFLIAWRKIMDLVKVTATEARTFNIDDRGVIRINPTFAATLSPAEFGGVLMHEIMHLSLDHAGRARAIGIVSVDGKVIDPQGCDDWNVAGDWVINERLKADGITLPKCAIYPPKDYPTDRARTSEAFYYWIREKRAEQAKQDEQDEQPEQGDDSDDQGDADQESQAGQGEEPGEGDDSGDQSTDQGDCSEPGGDTGEQGEETGQGQGQGDAHDPSNDPDVGGGCGVIPTDQRGTGEPEGLTEAEIRQMAREIRASARQLGIGVGTSKCLEALEPAEGRMPWDRLIRSGYETANAKRGHTHPTYSKRSRRSPPGVVMPGWIDTDPKIAFLIDASSSMDRQWMAQIVAEIERCAKLYQAPAYLITHTDRLCWEGWIRPGQHTRVTDAVAFEGGTKAAPAYEALARAGRFDVVVHFTDCEIEKPWPTCETKRLMIGAFGSGASGEPYSTPPEGAELIPVTEGAL
jgi:predicted metal-dependent peptidase